MDFLLLVSYFFLDRFPINPSFTIIHTILVSFLTEFIAVACFQYGLTLDKKDLLSVCYNAVAFFNIFLPSCSSIDTAEPPAPWSLEAWGSPATGEAKLEKDVDGQEGLAWTVSHALTRGPSPPPFPGGGGGVPLPSPGAGQSLEQTASALLPPLVWVPLEPQCPPGPDPLPMTASNTLHTLHGPCTSFSPFHGMLPRPFTSLVSPSSHSLAYQRWS